ncbi:MAG: hypothetical protein QXD38_07865 [Ignisphaera sp.]|uniref:hypothetical protein n=1 Tax=Thermofilum sp. TaxID=1961369 RepID=UPI0031656AB0
MPSWSIHRLITSSVVDEVRRLGYSCSEEFLRGVYEGVVDPDRSPDIESVTRVRVRRGKLYIREQKTYARHHGASKSIIDYYYNLSLYYARRGDLCKSGFMLGRALHYAQDYPLKRRKWLILDIHEKLEGEIEEIADDVINKGFCRDSEDVAKDVKKILKQSTKPEQVLCTSYRASKAMIMQYLNELREEVDKKKLAKAVRTVKTVKWLSGLVLWTATFALHSPTLLLFTIFASIFIAMYRPSIYYKAMRAGLMIVKPVGTKPAYTGQEKVPACHKP